MANGSSMERLKVFRHQRLTYVEDDLSGSIEVSGLGFSADGGWRVSK